MDVLELIDETFDKDRTETYELSIQVSLNGFSFAVKDTIRNTFIVLISKPFWKSSRFSSAVTPDSAADCWRLLKISALKASTLPFSVS